MERKIMHIDMDAFFAAIEQLDCPKYRGLPVIVGADPKGRGVVSTCSYEARKFGVHSAMPIREAYQRCPQGIFLPVRGGRYAEISRQIMKLLADYTPDVEPLSLDEAFLDLTGSQAIFGPAEVIARRIVDRILQEIGLSSSVGLASNKFLAKLASDLKKPKGFVIITPENIHETLDNLPVSKIWGVGPKTEAQLKEMGLRTIGDIGRINPQILTAKFGEAGLQLHRLANGLDDRPVTPWEETKSIGHEITFQVDTDDSQYLAGILLWLSDQVARRLRRHHLTGRVITLKLRDSDFKTLTKRTTLVEPTDFEETIYGEAVKLAQQIKWGQCKVRLIGVSVSDFSHPEQPVQLNLFGEPEPTESSPRARGEELKKLHQAVDQLKDRFGEGIITKGTILKVKEDSRKERKI